MNNYTDIRGRLHDKPVTDTDPFPSNNAWLYTAYKVKVDFSDIDNIDFTTASGVDEETLLICAIDRTRHRASDKIGPPISRDEILGMSFLGKTDERILENGWKFNPSDRPIPDLSIPKLLTQALALIVVIPYYKRILGVDVKLWHFELAHRNYFWKNDLSQLYRFAFSVPIQDRYSILKWSGRFKFYRPDHLFYAGVSLIDRMGKPSGIRWLKYGTPKDTMKNVELLYAMVQEFPEDHPIRVKVGI